MISRIRKSIQEKDKGFTLVELLVVVIIIGILAAVAIPLYMKQQDKAKDSSVKSDLANLRIAAASYAVDNDLAAADITAIEAEGVTTSPDTLNAAFTPNSTGDGFCIGAESTTGAFFSTDQTGVMYETVDCT